MSLAGLIGFALLVVAVLVALPALVLFIELVAAASTRGRGAAETHLPSVPEPLAVLMPAHDEAAGIGAAIAAVRAQLRPGDRLLVVADNCTDSTAEVARSAGAEVTERTDTVRRGKGYALDHGVRWLASAPPAMVVIVDADCIVEPGALASLAGSCEASGRPVQALYLMHAPLGAGLGQRIAAFAWIVKNRLRPLGGAALGWPCQLMGTGMAFPWVLIREAPLASGHLVEDMELGIALARAGAAPLFCPEALVTSMFPSDAAGARAQRTRWEHGHLSVLLNTGPRLLAEALLRRNVRLGTLALDLLVPPLAALALALVTSLAVGAAWGGFFGDWRSFGVAAAGTGLFGVGVILAWWQGGRHLVNWRELVAMPLYVAAKIPIYVRLFTRRQIEWVRTKRDDSSHR